MTIASLGVADAGGGGWHGMTEAFFEQYPEPLFVVDRSGEILLWNDAVAEMTGLPPEQAVGTPAIEVFGTEG